MAETEIREYDIAEVHDETIPAFSAIEMEGLDETPKSFGRLAWERFRRHKLALLGVIGLILIIGLFFVAPQFSDYTFDERNVRDRLLASDAHDHDVAVRGESPG